MSFSIKILVKSAYRSHRCDYCSEIIPKKSSYRKFVGINYEGDFCCNKVHLECDNPLDEYLKENDFYLPDCKMPRGISKDCLILGNAVLDSSNRS